MKLIARTKELAEIAARRQRSETTPQKVNPRPPYRVVRLFDRTTGDDDDRIKRANDHEQPAGPEEQRQGRDRR